MGLSVKFVLLALVAFYLADANGYQFDHIGQPCYDDTHDCVSTATCVPDNNEEGYDCMCFEGFGGDGRKKSSGCVDVDECAVYNTCQSLGQKCVNTYGSFVCSVTKP